MMGPRNNGWGICPECMRSIKVNLDGFLRYHGPGHGKGHCPGSSGRPLERPPAEIEEPLVVDLWPHESECVICGDPCSGRLGIPMFEGQVVGPGAEEWAGFDACEECYSDWRWMYELDGTEES